MANTREILEDRGQDYGDFSALSGLVQRLKDLIDTRNPRYTPEMRESLDMICLKLGRLTMGNPSKIDTWQDIAGYAELVVAVLERPSVIRSARKAAHPDAGAV